MQTESDGISSDEDFKTPPSKGVSGAAAAEQEETPFTKLYKGVLPSEIQPESIPRSNGVYLLSNIETCPLIPAYGATTTDRKNIPRLVKVGKADNLQGRIDSYLLSYPNGLYLYGYIETKTVDQARIVEMFLHNYFRMKGRRYRLEGRKHTHYNEWFVLTPAEISEFLATIAEKRRTFINEVDKIIGDRRLAQKSDAQCKMSRPTQNAYQLFKEDAFADLSKIITINDFTASGFGYFKRTLKKMKESQLQIRFKKDDSDPETLQLLYTYSARDGIAAKLFG